MKICVMAAVWNRQDITKIFALGINRLKESFNIQPITGTSNESDFELCKSLGLNPVHIENIPLGRKHNILLSEALKNGSESFLILGSDDLISNDSVQMMIDSKLPHVGFRSMIAYETRDGQMLNHTYDKNTRIIGAGRMISRYALKSSYTRTMFFPRYEKGMSGWHELPLNSGTFLERRGFGKKKGEVTGIWEDGINNSLDNSLDHTLALCGFPPAAIESDRIHIIDLKSETNVHQLGAMKIQEGKVTPYTGEYDWFLSKQEKTAIHKLRLK